MEHKIGTTKYTKLEKTFESNPEEEIILSITTIIRFLPHPYRSILRGISDGINQDDAVNVSQLASVFATAIPQIDYSPSNGIFDVLTGTIDGLNRRYTVSKGIYTTKKLIPLLNGGPNFQFTEVNPATGIFEFTFVPDAADTVGAIYW